MLFKDESNAPSSETRSAVFAFISVQLWVPSSSIFARHLITPLPAALNRQLVLLIRRVVINTTSKILVTFALYWRFNPPALSVGSI